MSIKNEKIVGDFHEKTESPEKAKLFMFVNYTPDDESIGITKKIGAQIASLKRIGYDVTYSAYTRDGVGIFSNDEIVYYRKYKTHNKKIRKTMRPVTLCKSVLEYLKQSGEVFDYCYGRISLPTKYYISVLKYFKDTGATVVIEALSYFPGVKNKSLLGKSTSFMIWVKKGQLRKVIDKFVTEGTVSYFYGIPTEKGRIGVDTEYLPKHVYLGSKNELNLISVATEYPYHGYDRLLKSLKQYNETGGSRPVKIHFVGTLLKTTLDCIDKYGLKDQVKYYGRLSGDRLKDVYNSCNVGIGPLAQHRIGGKKDTGLKTKEYLGIGLPYFYAGVEEDLPAHYPYAFQVPSDESCIDFEKIWQFYTSYRDKEEVASFMRQTAEELYSWDIIMKGALNF